MHAQWIICNTTVIIETVRSLWTWPCMGQVYHVPQNVFIVGFKFRFLAVWNFFMSETSLSVCLPCSVVSTTRGTTVCSRLPDVSYPSYPFRNPASSDNFVFAYFYLLFPSLPPSLLAMQQSRDLRAMLYKSTFTYFLTQRHGSLLTFWRFTNRIIVVIIIFTYSWSG